MPSHNDLRLDHTKIANAINQYPNATLVSVDKQNYKIKCDGKDVLLSIWVKAGGITTISSNFGKEKDLGEKIALFIIEKCKFSDMKAINHGIKTIKDDDFQLILDYLHEVIETLTINSSEIANGTKYELADTNFGDSFTIIKFNNGTIQLQGRPLKIYNELYAVISEIASSDDIIALNNELYKVNIDKAQVYSELEALIPLTYPKLCDTTKKILMSSIALSKLDIDLDDYSPFAFGALRGLEAFMKLMLVRKYHPIKDFGAILKSDSGKFKAQSEFVDFVKSRETIKVMENCYNFYHQNRHGIFHATDYPAASRLIDKSMADTIINSVFKLIEEGSNEI
jgi:hypothetical protein